MNKLFLAVILPISLSLSVLMTAQALSILFNSQCNTSVSSKVVEP